MTPVDDINARALKVGLPSTIHTAFAGTAQAYQDSLGSEPILIFDGVSNGLYCAGHALRELYSPHYYSFHASFRRCWAILALMITQDRPEHHRASSGLSS